MAQGIPFSAEPGKFWRGKQRSYRRRLGLAAFGSKKAHGGGENNQELRKESHEGHCVLG